MYGIISAVVCQPYSRDYLNILNSIDFTRSNFSPSVLLFFYHLKGNTLLLLPFDLFGFTPDVAVFTLYAVAASLRFWFTFRFLEFWDAVIIMFAFYWMLDWNQARFSLVFFLSYIVGYRLNFILPIFHFMVFFKVILDKLHSKLIFIAALAITLIIVFFSLEIVDFWNRYFIETEDEFPLYVIPYFLFCLIFFVLNGKKYLYKYGLLFSSLAWTFATFIYLGMSPVYFGRFLELFLLLSSYSFFLSRRYKGGSRIYARIILIFVGLYQTITVTGNVWRFFS